MSKKFQNSKNFEITFLDSSDDNDENISHWNLYCSNNEETYLEEKTEILWSRERKPFFSENDFFKNDYDSFSDLTGRSNSSCSWHNDDFDMKSSNKVSKSLEAIDDALYDKQRSPFISEEVYQECCDWSNKFPYLRLKGSQIVKPVDDSVVLYKADQKETLPQNFPNSSLGLHVEGKKMAIHVPEKPCKRANLETIPDTEQVDFFEEIVVSDGKYEECFALSKSENMNEGTMPSNTFVDDTEVTASLKSLQDKVIEKLAFNIWPKVLELLQKCESGPKTDKTNESFQLPPIAAASAVGQRRYIPIQRPQTEGNNLSMSDFPKLGSILSVSPKILQERKECRSGKSSLRSSRPNSEIHLSRKNRALSHYNNKNSSQKGSELLKMSTTPRQVQFVYKKSLKKEEKDNDRVSLYLPALEEDIADPVNYLKGFSLGTQTKTISKTVISHFPKNPECFLPPIDTEDNLHPDVKLTRNLFTFFGSDLKCPSRGEPIHKPKTPASRPNTSTSKKGIRRDNLNHKLLNDSYSSINNSNHAEMRKFLDNSEKQVTLFPIVTSLTPSKEKNCSSGKTSFLNTFGGRKR